MHISSVALVTTRKGFRTGHGKVVRNDLGLLDAWYRHVGGSN
jgi:hypothetical protein